MKQPKIRRFSYHPRFYVPEQGEEEGPRIKFRRIRSSIRPARHGSAVALVMLIVVLLYMLHYFNTLKKSEEASNSKVFQLEEIIVK